MKRSPRRLVIAAVVAVLVCAPLPSAVAQRTTTTRVSSLVLTSQTAWVGAGGTFSLRLAPPPPQTANPSDLEFAVSVHPASPTRSAFTRTLSARPTSAPLAVVTTPLADAPSDDTGAITIDVGVQDPALPHDRARVGLRGAGVYPVVVELRSVGGAVHARVLTHLIFQPAAPNGPKLAVGMVVPIRARLSLQPDGTDRLTATDASAIAAVAATLATLPTEGVLVDPSPESLAALQRGERVVDRAAARGGRRAWPDPSGDRGTVHSDAIARGNRRRSGDVARPRAQHHGRSIRGRPPRRHRRARRPER